jgi:MarR family transcriptional regulator, 2-MHQ and catechol-resistance regulon repressor
VKVVELIWLGQQMAQLGRHELQVSAPGVPKAELMVMVDLIDHAPSTITAIGQRTGYVQSRVSSAVAALVERGWVQTETDPSDGRRTLVVVPEQNLTEARASQSGINDRLEAALLDGLPPSRRPAMMRALEELLVVLQGRDRAGLAPDPAPSGPADR